MPTRSNSLTARLPPKASTPLVSKLLARDPSCQELQPVPRRFGGSQGRTRGAGSGRASGPCGTTTTTRHHHHSPAGRREERDALLTGLRGRRPGRRRPGPRRGLPTPPLLGLQGGRPPSSPLRGAGGLSAGAPQGERGRARGARRPARP